MLSYKKSGKLPVFIAREEFMHPLHLKYLISDDDFLPALSAAGLRKGFCCRTQLNNVIYRAWDFGIYKKIKKNDMFKKTLKTISKSNDISINVATYVFLGNYSVHQNEETIEKNKRLKYQ